MFLLNYMLQRKCWPWINHSIRKWIMAPRVHALCSTVKLQGQTNWYCEKCAQWFFSQCKVNLCVCTARQPAAPTFDPEVFHREDVLHIWYVSPAVKLFLAPVPLIHNRPLWAAGQDQMGFVGDLQIFNVCVPVPRVEWLVGVEAIAIPFIHCCGASLWEEQT